MGACNGLIIFRIIFMEKEQQIISTEDIVETLDSYLAKYTYDRLFVLVDEREMLAIDSRHGKVEECSSHRYPTHRHT